MIYIAGYRRAGNHFLIESLKKNFEGEFLKIHDRFDDINGKLIHIIRDPIDTLASNYRWWYASGESGKANIRGQMQSHSFQEYIRGQIPIENIRYGGSGIPKTQQWMGSHFKDPVLCLKKYLESFNASNLSVVYYENLRIDPFSTLIKIGKSASLVKKEICKYEKVDHKVGHDPDQVPPFDITADDKKYIWDTWRGNKL